MLPLLAVLTACSLLVDFDPEGQPCEPDGGCLEGYSCVDMQCVSSPGDTPDGGVSGGTDGGGDAGTGGTDGGRDGGADGGRDGGLDGGRG
ncbi:hypothetical protein [Hyalangium gracile]|uniref:hypothetical protein n=1 Tax=Hyalangium gracile TaxID=394092 RepID=UPI001CD02895|nr:hypothetical protein [Hyalangium gracile]